jgi:hypothetical protein
MEANEQNFYKRMNEIGEYKYKNRMDTVFVFQLVFIFLLIIIGIMYLRTINVITPFFTYPMIIFLVVISTFILINRIVLSTNVRDKNDYSELNSGKVRPSDYVDAGTNDGVRGLVNLPIPPSICPEGQQVGPTVCVPK